MYLSTTNSPPTQTKFVLDPAYKGPLLLEEHLRKIKAQSSFGRLVSTYNKRFFVLDLKRMMFYYLPERGSTLSSAKDIPFEIIKRIYIDSQLRLLDEGQMWKHGFVIISGRRSFKLISHSQGNMENLLYAFGHIIDTQTKKPLFDWNDYVSHRENYGSTMPLKPQINSPPGTISEQKENSSASATSLASPTANRNRPNQNVEKPTTTSIADTRTMSPDKGRQEDPTDRPREHERQTSIADTGNENPQLAAPVKKDPKEEPRPEHKLQGHHNVPLVQKHLNVKEVDKVDVCESQVLMSNESMLVSAVQKEQVQESVPVSAKEQMMEKNEKRTQNRVEALNIDPLESAVPMSNIPSSTRSRQNRRSVGHEFGNIKAKPLKSNEEELELGLNPSRAEAVGKLVTPRNGGFNPYYQRLLGQEQNVREEETIKRKDVMQQNNQDQVSYGNKPKLTQDDDWDREEVSVKKENVYKVEKKVEDDDDWDRDMESPPKKNKAKELVQKVKQDVDDWDSPPKKNITANTTKPQTNIAKKVQDDDDDWDNEMFGDDNGKPKVNNKFEIKTEAKYKDFTSSDTGFGKSAKNVEHSLKQNVVPATKATVHNDWDDDL